MARLAMSGRRPGALVVALALTIVAPCGGGDAALPAVTIAVVGEDGRAELRVEVARTVDDRGRGLMFREALAEDAGMLFVYEEDTTAGFWMKDTTIPLSIAFIAADGAILDIQDMEPLSEELRRPTGSYRYALEVNRGWFGRHGFGVADRVEIPDLSGVTGQGALDGARFA